MKQAIHVQVLQEIQSLTQKLIVSSLADQYNFPSCSDTNNGGYSISYSGTGDISIALKNVEYVEIYKQLELSKNYNFKMLDGALIQIMYTFDQSSDVTSHRLAYLPSPFLHEFQNEPELYSLDEIYADVIERNILPVPIRFDYDPDNYSEVEHPKSHMTLGQFKNCRIPVSQPVSPASFLLFILRSFYNTAFRKFTEEIDKSKISFTDTITSEERRLLHISIEQ